MLNIELAKLGIWFAVNKLSLKNVCINNERITKLRVAQFLEVFIDDDLNWKHHNNTVRTKLSKVTAITYKTSCLINHDGMYIFVLFSVFAIY